MKKHLIKTLFFTMVLSSASTALAEGRSGEMLANTCGGCHGTNGQSAGETMPIIAGLPKEYFVAVMQRFKSDDRYSTIMGRIAKGFSDEEIEAMGEFFSHQQWKSSAHTGDAALIAKGEKLHEELCKNCHLADGAYSEYTMPRLAGQWRDYLVLQTKECSAGKARVPQPTLMSKRLGELKDEDFAALAEFYASQK